MTTRELRYGQDVSPLPPATEVPSSRSDEAAAGWYGEHTPPRIGGWERELARRTRPKWDTFSWLTLRALIESVNDVIAKRAPAIVNERRQRYVEAQAAISDRGPRPPGRGAFKDGLVIDWTELERPRFLVAGDTGEADASQYATIQPLLDVHEGEVEWDPERQPSDFMILLSDVIYPAGDVNDYINAFYIPLRRYGPPVYAIPGNHDWYDGLDGFMYHFCAAEQRPSRRGRGHKLLRALWRRSSHPDREALDKYIAERHPLGEAVQPGPYFAIELADLILVAIDTGVTGELDAAQGRWLREISARDKDKVLLTGKPIWCNGRHHPGRNVREDGTTGTVDEIVCDPAHRYVAAIGGDTHNYQRYTVDCEGRPIEYIVAGGGGAYLSPTHTIPTLQPPLDEREFHCYPLRGDSLALFCRRVGPLLFKALVTLVLVAATAAVVVFVIVPLERDRRDAAIAAALGVTALAVAVPAARALASRIGGAPGPFGIVALALTVAAEIAALIVVADARAWVAAAIALALPAAVVAAALAAYARRGGVPGLPSNLLPVVPLVGLPPALWAPYGFGTTRDVLLYTAAPLLAALALTPVVKALRRGSGSVGALVYRGSTSLLWVGASAVVLERFGRGWMEQALLAVLGLLVLAGVAVPRLGPGRRRVPPRHDTVGAAATAVVGVALAGLAFAGLEALGGAVAPAAAATGIAALAGTLAAAAALYLLLGLGLIRPGTLLYLRRGAISPAGAARFVADELEHGLQPTRDGEPDAHDARRRGMAQVIRRLGKRVAVIADTNAPPFYKSFLSLEVRAGELELCCWGVTGYDDERRSPSLEDRVAIPLRGRP